MATRVYPIDWRDEFAQLAPYINGREGIVRVRYSGKRSAPSAFLETLKSEYECKNDNRKWCSIRIDHEVYSVRYLSGIREEFIRKIGLQLPEAHRIESDTASLSVGTNIAVGGNLHANIENVEQTNYISGDNPALMSQLRSEWVNDLCGQLKDFLSVGHMMVVVNHGNCNDQDEFWRFLWQDGLENLVEVGLLLVHMVDVLDESAGVHDLAPASYEEIDLPVSLGVHAMDHAIEDLTEIFTREFGAISKSEARVRADTLVRTHAGDIPRLHRQYSALLMQLAKQAD